MTMSAPNSKRHGLFYLYPLTSIEKYRFRNNWSLPGITEFGAAHNCPLTGNIQI